MNKTLFISKQKKEKKLTEEWLKKNKPTKCPDNYGHDHHDGCRASSIETTKYLKSYGENYNNLATTSEYTT